ncbi:MAG TPA: hypothetical protein PLC89_06145 [Haliscomenobacter sp.]|uniref:hypothetical protein n=1 Tax=Haliscomenobacter sp. TaxID=2717303 RepID=UPI002C0BA416|nr:hypothetical protein [Haliscomenobacter sp.]HOY16849.1 hypothetical protein [Haliscomenobacter sp.]HPH17527.1 hypothetical protein [Haliscomenobacter sp.]
MSNANIDPSSNLVDINEEFSKKTRTTLSGSNGTITVPSNSELTSFRIWSSQISPKKIVALDFGNSKNLLDKLKSSSPKYCFSLSKLVLPPNSSFINEILQVDLRNHSLAIINSAIENKKNIENVNRLHLDLIFNISKSEFEDHPCEEPQIMGARGGKACAFNVYGTEFSNDNPVPLFIIFYVSIREESDIKAIIINKLIQLNLDLPLEDRHNCSKNEWHNLFLIPILLPNLNLIYYAIPDYEGGRTKLLDWLNHNTGSIAIDRTLEFIDPWEVFITLDARPS